MSTNPADLEGRELPSGRVTIPRWKAFLWADATRAEDDTFRYEEEAKAVGGESQFVPPTLCIHLLNEASGTVEEALEGLNINWEAGIYLGELSFAFHQPVYVGETYSVEGRIQSVEHKHGSEGEFDVVLFAYDVVDEDDEPVLESIKNIILME